jgi:hypothetical protein
MIGLLFSMSLLLISGELFFQQKLSVLSLQFLVYLESSEKWAKEQLRIKIQDQKL